MSNWTLLNPGTGNFHSVVPDYDLGDLIAISAGKIPGHTRVFLAGFNNDVDIVPGTEDVWPGGGLYPFKASAGPLELVGTNAADTAAGTGARSVTVQGLDGNYNPLTATVNTNGLTPVALPGTWLRVNFVSVAAAGSGLNNAGDMHVRDAGAGTIRAYLVAGLGRSAQLVYTVPRGSTLFILAGVGTVPFDPDGTVYVGLWRRSPAGVLIAGQLFPLVAPNPPFHFPLQIPAAVPEMTDLVVRATFASFNDMIVTCSLEGLLISNDQIRG